MLAKVAYPEGERVAATRARILHNMPLIKVFKVHLSAARSFRQTETVSTTVKAN